MVNDMSSENEVDVFFLNSSKGKYTMEMRRKVWLEIGFFIFKLIIFSSSNNYEHFIKFIIAKYVVEKQQDVIACMNLLKESNNIIKIQVMKHNFLKSLKEPL